MFKPAGAKPPSPCEEGDDVGPVGTGTKERIAESDEESEVWGWFFW